MKTFSGWPSLWRVGGRTRRVLRCAARHQTFFAAVQHRSSTYRVGPVVALNRAAALIAWLKIFRPPFSRVKGREPKPRLFDELLRFFSELLRLFNRFVTLSSLPFEA